MEEIADDLLTEILTRLPDCREAGRCAAVCKRWSSLISTVEFVRSFTDRRLSLGDADFSTAVGSLWLWQQQLNDNFTASPKRGEFYHLRNNETRGGRRPQDYLKFPLVVEPKSVIWSSCDDLLLFSRFSMECLGEFSFGIHNPMTNKYWYGIPEPPRGVMILSNCAFAVRDNGGCLSCHVTLFFRTEKSDGVGTWTTHFSSEIGHWSSPAPIKMPPEVVTSRRRSDFASYNSNESITCCGGLLYWVEIGQTIFWEWVVAFDPLAAVSSEGHRECRFIPRPADVGNNFPSRISVCLGNCRGRLRATYISHKMVCKVWELTWHGDCRDIGSSCCWSLVHNVVLQMRIESAPYYPLAMHPVDRDVIFLGLYGVHIIMYDISSRTGQIVGPLPLRINLWRGNVYPLFSIWPTPVHLLQSA